MADTKSTQPALLRVLQGRTLRLMIVSDLDHTMVQNEDPSHKRLLAFNELWTTRLKHDGLLVFSTGRSPELFRKLWSEAPLLTPSVLICSVGSEIFYLEPDGSGYRPDPAWEEHLDEGGAWDREQVAAVLAKFPELKEQAATEQRRHKLSYLLQGGGKQDKQDVVDRIAAALREANLPAKVIFSGGEDVDVLSRRAGKGGALDFLLQELKDAGAWPAQGVLVSGDSGNDLELLAVPGVLGCAVANAHDELRQWAADNAGPNVFQATEPCAGGIIEALHHYRCLPRSAGDSAAPLDSLPDSLEVAPPAIEPELYAQAWRLAERALKEGGAGSDSGSSTWVDRLSASGGNKRWVVNFMACRLASDGTRDATATRDVTATLVRLDGGDYDVQDLQAVVPDPDALARVLP